MKKRNNRSGSTGHARRKAKKRFGIRLTDRTARHIINLIEKGEYIAVRPDRYESHKIIATLMFYGDKINAVYDHVTRTLVTIF